MKYFIRFSYDGSKFYGFQRLHQFLTVQGVIEDALTKITGDKVEIKGAGRTDRGVHAKGQCAHFSLESKIPCDGLMKILNKIIGPYIHVYECKYVEDHFHARFSVLKKTYRYQIYLGEYDPCVVDYAYMCPYSLNIDFMENISKSFLGIHDFQNFVSGERDNYLAIIYDIQFKRTGNYLNITFIGKSFYRYMVRNLVGALLDIGRGKRSGEELQKSLEILPYDKRFSTAPSCGLYLEKIDYELEFHL